MKPNRRLLLHFVLVLLIVVILANVVIPISNHVNPFTGIAAAYCGYYVYYVPYYGPYVGYGTDTCPPSGSGKSAEPDPPCGLFIPDVGDAAEKGLIGTDAQPPVGVLIATDDNLDSVVAQISDYYVGTDTFQIPEQYRSAEFWFRVDACGRWHNGAELGFGE